MLVPWIDTSLSHVVSCGEFLEGSQPESSAFPAQSNEASLSECLDHGPTIVYVPTRKETVELANFLCKSGVRAAAYNAKVIITVFFMHKEISAFFFEKWDQLVISVNHLYIILMYFRRNSLQIAVFLM